MEYHTAIKNDGLVKEYLMTWGNVHKILKKKSRLQDSMFYMPPTLLKQLFKKESPRPPRLFTILFHCLQDIGLINSYFLWLRGEHRNLMPEGLTLSLVCVTY